MNFEKNPASFPESGGSGNASGAEKRGVLCADCGEGPMTAEKAAFHRCAFPVPAASGPARCAHCHRELRRLGGPDGPYIRCDCGGALAPSSSVGYACKACNRVFDSQREAALHLLSGCSKSARWWLTPIPDFWLSKPLYVVVWLVSALIVGWAFGKLNIP